MDRDELNGARDVAYVVSRFPSSSETFIARELNAVAALGVEIELCALFPAKESLVHPSARPWMPKLFRPGLGAGVAALAWWLVRRPLRLLGCAAAVVRDCSSQPGYMLRSLAALPAAAAIARRVAADRIPRVHAHYATYPALAAWACKRLAGVPYSFTAHAHDIFVTQAMLARKAKEADFVVPISRFNADWISQHAPAASETPMRVVHCGIETSEYEFRPRQPPAGGPVRALCVASLQEHKGHEVLFEALASAPEALARVELDLVGAGPLRSELEAKAARLGLSDRVRFLGSKPEDEVRGLLAQADVFVLPSRRARDGQMEGLPVALMESLACGLSTVASRLSGIPELVEDSRTGYLAEPGDPASLAQALERCLEGNHDPAAGRAIVEREFEITRSAQALAALFTGSDPKRGV